MRIRGFTLLEVILAVALAVLLLTLALPSVSGVMAERRVRERFDAFDGLVQQAVEHSVSGRVPHTIVWTDDAVVLTAGSRPDPDSPEGVIASIPIGDDEQYQVSFPAALDEAPPPVWTFWPTGTCEPAVVAYQGPQASWTARYDALTGMATLESSEAR